MTDLDRGHPTPDPRLSVARDAVRSRRRVTASWRPQVLAYIALTKPRIIELLLVTTLPAMILAAGGWPDTRVVFATMVGGSAAAGSANALNCFLDRDIDAIMARTARRPLNGSAVSPAGALVFGLLLGVVAVGVLWLTTNLLATGLTAAAIALYVLGYTLLLKRRTSSNIVWGGSAGCMPTLIGWAAVTGRLSLAPFVLFGIVFFWTPPHFWALAMRFREDYAAAGVPMLPVVATARVVTHRMAVYTWATVGTSLALWPAAHTGYLYPAAALVLGAGFLREVERLRRQVARGETLQPMRVFHWSISYLSGLFACLALDVLVRSWW